MAGQKKRIPGKCVEPGGDAMRGKGVCVGAYRHARYSIVTTISFFPQGDNTIKMFSTVAETTGR